MTTLAYTAADLEDMSRSDMISNLKLLREDGHNICALNIKSDLMRTTLLGMLDGVTTPSTKLVLSEVTANVPAEIVSPSPKKEAPHPKKEQGDIERNFVGDEAMLDKLRESDFAGEELRAEVHHDYNEGHMADAAAHTNLSHPHSEHKHVEEAEEEALALEDAQLEEEEVQEEGDEEASMLDASVHSDVADLLQSVILYDSEPDDEEEGEEDDEDEEEEEDAMMAEDSEEMAMPTPVSRATTEASPQMRTHIKFDDDGEVATLQKMAARTAMAATAEMDVHAQPLSWTPVKHEADFEGCDWTPVKEQEDALEMLDQGAVHVDAQAYRDTNDNASPQMPQQWSGTHTYFGDENTVITPGMVMESAAVAAADRAAAEDTSEYIATQSSEVDDIFNQLTL
jgi:hypothetical protein